MIEQHVNLFCIIRSYLQQQTVSQQTTRTLITLMMRKMIIKIPLTNNLVESDSSNKITRSSKEPLPINLAGKMSRKKQAEEEFQLIKGLASSIKCQNEDIYELS